VLSLVIPSLATHEKPESTPISSSSHSSFGSTSLSIDLLFDIKYKSNNSRTIFARNLVRELFDKETREKSNISGVFGKIKLNPQIIAKIRNFFLQMFPTNLEKHETDLTACKLYHLAIDSYCRDLSPKCVNSLLWFIQVLRLVFLAQKSFHRAPDINWVEVRAFRGCPPPINVVSFKVLQYC